MKLKRKKLVLGLIVLGGLSVMFFNRPVNANGGSGRTALQDHVDFFDRDNDGFIRTSETAQGLRALGTGWARSWTLATAINAGLGRTTGAPWNDPLTVNTNKIHLGIHGSDTGVYDDKGHFVRAKFEKIFQLYDKDKDDALSEDEFGSFFAGYKTDTVGSLASRAEFGLLLEVAGEDRRVSGSWWWSSNTKRVLTRSRLQQFYDGTLFYLIAGEPIPFRAP